MHSGPGPCIKVGPADVGAAPLQSGVVPIRRRGTCQAFAGRDSLIKPDLAKSSPPYCNNPLSTATRCRNRSVSCPS